MSIVKVLLILNNAEKTAWVITVNSKVCRALQPHLQLKSWEVSTKTIKGGGGKNLKRVYNRNQSAFTLPDILLCISEFSDISDSTKHANSAPIIALNIDILLWRLLGKDLSYYDRKIGGTNDSAETSEPAKTNLWRDCQFWWLYIVWGQWWVRFAAFACKKSSYRDNTIPDQFFQK